MPSVLSNYGGNAALALLLSPTGMFLALHTSDPTVTGILATEVAGGGYERQPITFSSASNKTMVSTNTQTFPGMPVVTVTHLAVWDSISGGNMIFTKALATPITTTESGQVLTAVGDIAVTL